MKGELWNWSFDGVTEIPVNRYEVLIYRLKESKCRNLTLGPAGAGPGQKLSTG